MICVEFKNHSAIVTRDKPISDDELKDNKTTIVDLVPFLLNDFPHVYFAEKRYAELFKYSR